MILTGWRGACAAWGSSAWLSSRTCSPFGKTRVGKHLRTSTAALYSLAAPRTAACANKRGSGGTPWRMSQLSLPQWWLLSWLLSVGIFLLSFSLEVLATAADPWWSTWARSRSTLSRLVLPTQCLDECLKMHNGLCQSILSHLCIECVSMCVGLCTASINQSQSSKSLFNFCRVQWGSYQVLCLCAGSRTNARTLSSISFGSLS